MAPRTRVKAAATKPEATKPENSKPDDTKPETQSKGKKAAKDYRQKRQALRQKLYKKSKMTQRKRVFQGAIKSADSAEVKTSLRAAVYRRWNPKSTGEKTAEVEELVKKQEEKVRELKKRQAEKKAAKAEAEKPKPAAGKKVRKPRSPSAPRRKGKKAAKEVSTEAAAVAEPMEGVEETKTPTSAEEEVKTSNSTSTSPVKKSKQPTERAAEDSAVPAKIEPPAAAAAEPMEGVEETKKEEVEYPTLPSVEEADAGHEVKETVEEPAVKKRTSTPAKPKYAPRELSAESNAGTPRTLRRSPRKRTVKG